MGLQRRKPAVHDSERSVSLAQQGKAKYHQQSSLPETKTVPEGRQSKSGNCQVMV